MLISISLLVTVEQAGYLILTITVEWIAWYIGYNYWLNASYMLFIFRGWNLNVNYPNACFLHWFTKVWCPRVLITLLIIKYCCLRYIQGFAYKLKLIFHVVIVMCFMIRIDARQRSDICLRRSTVQCKLHVIYSTVLCICCLQPCTLAQYHSCNFDMFTLIWYIYDHTLDVLSLML